MPGPSLTALEEDILRRSADSEVTRRRRRMVIIAGGVLLIVIAGAEAVGVSRGLMTLIFAAHVLVSSIEKVAYANAVLAYKSVIRKLAANQRTEPPGVGGDGA